MTHNFPTSPAIEGEQRKFINPTPGYVGANIFGAEGKPTAIAVEPGGEVWLTPAEERMTAEAPRRAEDNPFVKEWEEPVDWDAQTGEPTRTITRQGVLVLADEPARPIASDRFIPERQPVAVDESTTEEDTAADEDEVKGSDVPAQPPVEGQPSPDEVVGTPDAPDANAGALSERESTAEQKTVPKPAGAISA